MRIETPQILWHNGTENDNGKNAPLYSAALLPIDAVPAGINAADTDAAAATTAADSSGGAGSGGGRHVLATAGNTSEIHLWEVIFRNNDDEQQHDEPAVKKQRRILQSSSSNATNVKHLLTLSRQVDRSINAVSFSPDGHHLAAVGDGGTVLVFTMPYDLRPKPGTNAAQTATAGQMGAGSASAGGAPIGAAVGAASTAIVPASTVAPSAANATNASATAAPSTPGQSWSSLSSEKLLKTRVLPTPSTEDVMDVSWSADSKRFVVGCLDHTVVVYENVNHGINNAAGRSSKSAPPAATGPGIDANEATPSTADAGPANVDGDMVDTTNNADGGGNDADTAAANGKAPPSSSSANNSSSSANSSSDLEEVKWRTVHRSTSDHQGYVQGVSYDPQGVYIASQGSDRTVRVWTRKTVKIGSKGTSRPKKSEGGGGGGGGVLTPTDQNAANKEGNDSGADGEGNKNDSSSDMDDDEQDQDQQDEEEKRRLKIIKQAQIQAAMQRALTESKFELVGKGKCIKFRNSPATTVGSTAASNATNAANAATSSAEADASGDAKADDEPSESKEKADENKQRDENQPSGDEHKNSADENRQSTAGDEDKVSSSSNNDEDKSGGTGVATTTTTATRRHHLFADESTVESFFRRLSWTCDGSYLIVPAALWHDYGGDDSYDNDDDDGGKDGGDDGGKDDGQEEGSKVPTFATYLFARHNFDGPCRVLSGLEKPSVVVRPNPVLFKLPPSAAEAASSSKENDPDGEGSVNSKRRQQPLPYRSIFAVLSLDSVIVYDTHHVHPLCVARGLHYAGLTDAAWSADGRNLIVTSTDGYVSILTFEDGELGEVYRAPTPPPQFSSLEAHPSETSSVVVDNDARRSVPPEPLPPCEPGQTATIVAPPAKKAKTTAGPEGMEEAPSTGADANETKKAKRRVAPIPVVAETTSGRDDDGDEERASSPNEVAGGVTKLSLEGKKGEGAAAAGADGQGMEMQEPKKKKKRVQPMLVTCKQ